MTAFELDHYDVPSDTEYPVWVVIAGDDDITATDDDGTLVDLHADEIAQCLDILERPHAQ